MLVNGNIMPPETPRRIHFYSEICSTQQRNIYFFSSRAFHENKNFSDLDTLIHLAKGSFGTGVFAMPFAFANAGYVTGLFGSLIIGFICSHCVHILVQYAR
jgi:Transmembrane amino acid transporter protein